MDKGVGGWMDGWREGEIGDEMAGWRYLWTLTNGYSKLQRTDESVVGFALRDVVVNALFSLVQ